MELYLCYLKVLKIGLITGMDYLGFAMLKHGGQLKCNRKKIRHWSCRGWRDSSEVESACSSKRPELGFQYPL